MDVVRDLAKAVRDLDRVSSRYDDEELKDAAMRIMEQLGVVVNILGRLTAIYEELEALVKGILRLDTAVISEIELEDGEEIAKFIGRCKEAGVDHNKLLAYLLGTGKARLEVGGDGVRLRIFKEGYRLVNV